MWYKLKRIMMRPNGVEKQVRPDTWWQPWANTLAYYKFNWNLNDSSGNGRNLNMYTGSFSYSTLSSWQPYCQLNTNAQAYFSSFPFNRTAYTVSWWCYFTDVTSSNQKIIMDLHDGGNYFPRFYAWGWNHSGKISSVVSFDSYDPSWATNTRYYLVAVIKNNVSYSYINWNLIHSQSYSNSATSWSLFLNGTSNHNSGYYTSWRISELILENKARTAQEISNYYNQTKSDYWL